MIRLPRAATLVTAGLLATQTAAADLQNMTKAERDAFRAEVRSYLMENPEVILEAVQLLEQRQADAQARADFDLVADNVNEIFNDGYSWEGGNLNGDIVLVEFLDYRCGFCRRATPEVERLLAEDGNIKLIIKEFPILGEASLLTSRFAIAVKQVVGGDAYKDVHDALIEMTGEPNHAVLRRLSDSLGFDTEAVMAAMDSDAVTSEIARTRALAQRLQINGTPSFVLQDELLRGFLPADQMAVMIADKRG